MAKANDQAVTATPVASRAEINVWERMAWLEWAWPASFYGVLIAATVFALTGSTQPWSERGLMLGLTVLFGGWYVVGMRSGFRCTDPATWVPRPIPIIFGYLAVSGALWFGLVTLDDVYGIASFCLFLQVFMFLPPRWAISGSLTLAGLLISRVIALEGADLGLWVLTFLFPLGVISMLVLYLDAVARQNAERQRLIEELESTRAELATRERQAGMLEERQRLAGEIHDTLAQGFTSIVMHLEAAEGSLSGDRTTVERHLD